MKKKAVKAKPTKSKSDVEPFGSLKVVKVAKEKTKFDNEGLNLAVYCANNFLNLKKGVVDLKPKTTWMRDVQEYLDENFARVNDNILRGAICVADSFRNATGGRVHIIVGLSGPVMESFEIFKAGEPKYKAKSDLFKRMLKNASGIKPPYAGNIHFHLFHCKHEKVTPKMIIDFLAIEHGPPNDLNYIAQFNFAVLINLPHKPYWRKNGNAEILQSLFGKDREL